jgi:hypothetical protein
MSLRASTPSGRPATHRDPVPLRALPSAPEQPQPSTHARHRQNGMGDVVLPVEHGEIVALPRLWDFDLERLEDGEATLRTDTGLVAVVTFLADTAVVADVAEGEREIA